MIVSTQLTVAGPCPQLSAWLGFWSAASAFSCRGLWPVAAKQARADFKVPAVSLRLSAVQRSTEWLSQQNPEVHDCQPASSSTIAALPPWSTGRHRRGGLSLPLPPAVTVSLCYRTRCTCTHPPSRLVANPQGLTHYRIGLLWGCFCKWHGSSTSPEYGSQVLVGQLLVPQNKTWSVCTGCWDALGQFQCASYGMKTLYRIMLSSFIFCVKNWICVEPV